MEKKKATEHLRLEMIQLCHRGLDSRTLRAELLRRLRKILPIDVASFATTDPATLLFTGAVIDDCLEQALPQLLENEFLQEDFNKFHWLVKNHLRVGVLSEVTQHELERSPRYRDILKSLALGDELRIVLVSNVSCWGILCLYRERSGPLFTPAEAAFLAQLTPHFAEGLRKALLLGPSPLIQAPNGPGVLILSDDLSVIAMTPVAEHWLTELAEGGDKHRLPQVISAVVARLQEIERGGVKYADLMPKARLRTPSGQWLVVYASRLNSSEGQGQISVIFELAQPREIAPLIMQAYDLTRREGEITQLILQGLATTEIATTLHISTHTVQDHLKAIFEKVGIRSRRELANRIFAQQYQPRFGIGTPLNADGWFAGSGMSKD